MTWPTGPSDGSGSGWYSGGSDETRPAPTTAPTTGAWTPDGWGGGSGSTGGGFGGATGGDPGDSWTQVRPSGQAAETTQSGPPLVWLGVAAVVPLLAASLFALTGPVVNGIGWAVAAFGAVALLGVFQAQDLARRSSNWYAAQDSLVGGLRLLVLVLAFAVGTAHAVFLAFWIARLDMFA